MKKLAVFFLVLISCNQDSENEKSSLSSEAITSPSGIVFAKNKLELVHKAAISFERNDILITNIEFKENIDLSSAIIDVKSEDGTFSSNFVIVKRIPSKIEKRW